MDSISIKGYKTFKDITVSLKPINILIGSNGSGKSNFLSLFELLGYAYEGFLARTVVRYGGLDKILHKGRRVTNHIYIKTVEGKNSYELDLIPYGEVMMVENEKVGYLGDSNEWNYNSIAYYAKETELKWHTGEVPGDYIKKYMSQIKKFHFHETGWSSPLKGESNISTDIYFLYPQGNNIAAFLYEIKNKEPLVYRRIVNVIQSVAPFFKDFFLEPNEYGNLSLKWIDTYSETLFSPNELSDGTIRFIALAVLFMQPKLPKVIVIDEPELGLHPFAIDKLAGLIRSAANRGTQVIAATQSAELISNFQPEDILTVDQREGESYIKRLNADDLKLWLDDYTIGDLCKQRIINSGQP